MRYPHAGLQQSSRRSFRLRIQKRPLHVTNTIAPHLVGHPTAFAAPQSNSAPQQKPLRLTSTRVTFREVSYMALDKSCSGTLSQWVFLEDFQPVAECNKKGSVAD
jgi:hypothetical protein